ncbi:PHB depolymerase family esterase [Shewanella sp. JM162201]|uniref:PHB depolymerase family esterase n=1 Tax=Shewanella jiangmenensis TaxID=2837387 RepID=A0ABS5V297_9GAMM|nr:PHB depolymerase family esterase [Shewanella jiangmenensis]MBT1443942.1 PHB depolymerase family esterase [Shewanella jiangmenensis]
MFKTTCLTVRSLALVGLLSVGHAGAAQTGAFEPLAEFGANPGELSASYLPAGKPGATALVVLLHGCVQDGVELSNQSGLSAMAARNNVAVLVAQQSFENNVKRCFNWFSPQDTDRDSGEMLSLKNMIAAASDKAETDRVYLLGLSAGGAMASALLVNYPDSFAAAAVVAGLPYPCADNLTKAISCMKQGPAQSGAQLAEAVRALNPGQTKWPALSVWTGSADLVVNPENSRELAAQWVTLSGAPQSAAVTQNSGYRISSWGGENASPQVSLIEIDGMGHGIAVDPDSADGGSAGDYLLKAPISTVKEVLHLWGI